jgi:hypothetical protein
MILLLDNQILNLNGKVSFTAQNISSELGSEFNSIASTPWVGDLLTTESLFPQWILKQYKQNPENVTIVPFIKYYFRWLFSQDYGYGAQLDWENIRVPAYMNSIFLEALAEFYFPGMDFSATPYSEILPNIRKFATKIDENYFNLKGTPSAIKYLICSLLGFNWSDVYVVTAGYASFEIQISSAQLSNLQQYDAFLKEYVIPAGMVIQYKAI